jgi:hypothetical protein
MQILIYSYIYLYGFAWYDVLIGVTSHIKSIEPSSNSMKLTIQECAW